MTSAECIAETLKAYQGAVSNDECNVLPAMPHGFIDRRFTLTVEASDTRLFHGVVGAVTQNLESIRLSTNLRDDRADYYDIEYVFATKEWRLYELCYYRIGNPRRMEIADTYKVTFEFHP